MPHFTRHIVVLEKSVLQEADTELMEGMKELREKPEKGFRLSPRAHSAVADLVFRTRSGRSGGCFFASEDPELVGRLLIGKHHAIKIRHRWELYEELMLLGLVEEHLAIDLMKKPAGEFPEIHLHFDVHGWIDSTGTFREGIPRILEDELADIVHKDSFNPMYTVLTKKGEMRAADAFRETPHLFTSGHTCRQGFATPADMRMSRLGYDALASAIEAIEKKHNIQLVGYIELEAVSVIKELPVRPFSHEGFSRFCNQGGSVLKARTADLEAGFKSCEFHLKLGEGYDSRVLNLLLDIGLINAAMPPKEDGSFTPYFTAQLKNASLRDQLAIHLARLANEIGGFGDGARIQLETILAHKFFGPDFSPKQHLPQIVTGYQVAKGRCDIGRFLNDKSNHVLITGEAGKAIPDAMHEAAIEESYRKAQADLRGRPTTPAEVAEACRKMNSWDDNPDKSEVLSRTG